MWLMYLHFHLLLCILYLRAGADGPAGGAQPLHLALHHSLSLVASCVTPSTSSLLRAARVTAASSLEEEKR